MLCKMIYFSSHKFAFLKSPFFVILRTFSSITRKICVQIKNKVHHVNQLKEPDPMMYTHMPFSKKKPLHSTPLHSTPLHLLHSTHSLHSTPRTHSTHSTHSTYLLKIFFLPVNPFHCFFAKSLWTGKKLQEIIFYIE